MSVTFTVFKGSPSKKITESQTTVPALLSDQVLIKNTHSGVCGTDAHYLHADMVLGHEGVGIVQAVGDGVSLVKVYVMFPACYVIVIDDLTNVAAATELDSDTSKMDAKSVSTA